MLSKLPWDPRYVCFSFSITATDAIVECNFSNMCLTFSFGNLLHMLANLDV